MRRSILVAVLAAALAACAAPQASNPGAGEPPASREGGQPAAVAKGAVLLAKAGHGTHSSKTFAAPDAWDLRWSYDCTRVFGGQGNFIVTVQPTFDTVNQLGRADAGVEHFHQGGRLHLEVNSECTWRVRAVAA
jgi:hypothetical protein